MSFSCSRNDLTQQQSPARPNAAYHTMYLPESTSSLSPDRLIVGLECGEKFQQNSSPLSRWSVVAHQGRRWKYIPSLDEKFNWYLLFDPFGNLYPSQNTYGRNCLNTTVAGPTLFIQLLSPTNCVTKAVQMGIVFSGPRRAVASKRTTPES